MTEMATVLILAMTVEALVEYANIIFAEQAFNWKQLAAALLGVSLAVLAQVDLFQVVGVTFAIPFVGMILTGILFSRGANYVSDFIKLIQSKVDYKNDSEEA